MVDEKVESRLQPELQGKPVAVVQYNQWRSGGIIAVNYEARDFGVTRHMRGKEAKEKCPDIVLVSVPSVRGKADTSKYRCAGREVIDVLKKHCSIIERASVDEAYLDITELVEKRISSHTLQKNLMNALTNTYVVSYCENDNNNEEQRINGIEKWLDETYGEVGDEQARKLAIAGVIVEELRAEIFATCKFRCSAGISYNKILAKLACGLHKPNRQTILPSSAVPSLFATLPIKKVRNLGGKFGNIITESLGCNVMADLTRFSLQDLQKRFDEKTGSWLYNIARGIDNESVVTRLVCKSIGASKNFPGKQAIVKLEMLKHWVNELAIDVSDRLEQDREENERRATTLTVSFSHYEDRKVISQSRTCPLKSYKSEKIASQCIDILIKSTQKPIVNISIAAGKFIPAKGSGNFVNFFKSNGQNSKPKDKTTPYRVTVNSIDVECKNDVLASKEMENLTATENPKKIVAPFFSKEIENRGKKKVMDEPISPSTAILGSEQSKKALNRENLKNSFFMNFLKDSKPEISQDPSKNDLPMDVKDSILATIEQSPVEEKNSHKVDNQRVEKNTKLQEVDLLSQLHEIFPDLDNIDRSVVQLLPMELQQFANSYLKTKSSQKVRQPVKNVAKIGKSKSTKSKTIPKANSLQNFFVKTDSTLTDEPNLKKCSECSLMIKIDKYTEHLDFHVAKNLHREMNRVDSSGSSVELISSKRRRSDESPTTTTKKVKGISTFFDR
ncbi:DNApol-eta isoform X2 [Venturia canescens]|uniref:DNApol-eta isoform X2 n=1 Tax=Venturia canescens TaxID=32260 RepID=UPI001C9BCAF6|nr:DNApol-eta isoform X2 [Venturia canescens]